MLICGRKIQYKVKRKKIKDPHHYDSPKFTSRYSATEKAEKKREKRKK